MPRSRSVDMPTLSGTMSGSALRGCSSGGARASVRASTTAISPARLTRLRPEDEIDGTEDAQSGPEVVELHRLAHVQQREGHEHGEGEHFLQDLELREAHYLIANAIRGDLEHVLEERDAPASQGRHPPGLRAHVSEVRIPRERHEDVRA